MLLLEGLELEFYPQVVGSFYHKEALEATGGDIPWEEAEEAGGLEGSFLAVTATELVEQAVRPALLTPLFLVLCLRLVCRLQQMKIGACL